MNNLHAVIRVVRSAEFTCYWIRTISLIYSLNVGQHFLNNPRHLGKCKVYREKVAFERFTNSTLGKFAQVNFHYNNVVRDQLVVDLIDNYFA